MEKFALVQILTASPLQPPSLTSCTGQLPNRPHFDAAYASRRHVRGDSDGIVQIVRLNQIEPSQALLRLREWSVPDRHLPVAHSHRAGGTNGLKRFRREASALVSEGVVVGHTLIVGHRPDFLFFTINQAQVLQSASPQAEINVQPQ
jgi:hypothetical protein